MCWLLISSCSVIATQLGHSSAAWELCEALWLSFFNHKNYADWILTHRIAIPAARAANHVEAEARLLAQLARAETELGDFDAAEEHLRRSRHLAEGNGPLLASAYEFTGILELEREDPDAAIEWLSKSLRIFSDLNWARAISIQRHHLGRAHLAAGRVNRAKELLRAAADGIDRERDAITLGQILIELGRAQETLEPVQAIESLEEALALLSGLGVPFDIARAKVTLGDLHFGRGDTVRASAEWTSAYELLVAIDSSVATEVRRRLDQ